MNRKKLYRKIQQGSLKNIRFADLMNLAEGFGFQVMRQSGSHRIMINREIGEILNLQPGGKDAKPYQIRQLLDYIDEYGLDLEE